jgi:uncharacterized protein YyaL (SSP411 family)
MTNRLGSAVSPYLRSHAGNPVDWQEWGSEPFAEAERRQVPVLISIGYSTCHWCHVMARESFSDPALAAYLNENFVSVKVDREEHPDVDSSYLAAASAFTDQLGWPLTVFATPAGRAFYAGSYFPPAPTSGLPSFREVLEAMVEAWRDRRDDVEDTASRLAAALATPPSEARGELPRPKDFDAAVDELLGFEDEPHGGFGGAPKFPVAPVIGFLLDRADTGDDRADALARRTLAAMARSPLRDAVEGGFFRYATRPDWSEPHYERMLYDNALLLDAYSRIGDRETAGGVASFLLGVLRLPSGGFASAQDSESTVDGARVEGGYYALTADERARQSPPALDEKVLTGWNGLAVGALAAAGSRLGRSDWIAAAVAAARLVSDDPIVRARIGRRVSTAVATLEDYGMLADGLVDLALATGDAAFAIRARELVTSTMTARGYAVPGGADPVLVSRGLALENDPSEGAYPSGISAIARAAVRLDRLGAGGALREAALEALGPVAPLAIPRPISFGAALGVMSGLSESARQLVVVTEDADAALVSLARSWSGGVVAVVTSAQALAFARAGFELFEARDTTEGRATAYLCENFVCQLPVTEPAALAGLLA